MFTNEKTNKLIKSMCEVNIDGKMGLLSLYDDLPHFEYDLTIDNLENSNKKLKILIQELKQQIKKLENENSHFKSLNLILSKNISSLYKTAKSEIQRKDRTIEELRKSNMYAPPTSKMFSYCNKLPLEKTQINKCFKEVKDTEHINKVAEKSNVINEINNDNLTNVGIHPNNDIPKTVYYTRLCKKLTQQNKMNVSKNKMPKDIQNIDTISTDNITQDKNEELNNDKNILKEMLTPSIRNDSENNPNSTLVICESDSISSDCELHTTPINQFENSEKDKENVSVQSFFTMLKQPTKLKKKMIIAPATIGVQNMLSENMKSAEKLNRSRKLISKIQHEIIESQKIQTLNTDIKSTSNNEENNKCDSKMDDKQLAMADKVHNQKLHTSNNFNEISKNIEVEHVPVIKEMIIEKDINPQMPKKVRNSSHVTGLSPSTDNEFNTSSKDNSLFMNDEKELCTLSKLQNNQLNSELPIIKYVSNLTDNTLLNDPVKGFPKKSFVETSKSSINIEVEQIPNRKKTIVVGKDNNNTVLNEVRNSSHVTCLSPSTDNEFNISFKDNSLLMNDEKELCTLSKLQNNQLNSELPIIKHVSNSTDNTLLNDPVKGSPKKSFAETSKSSINIEVEQIPNRRKTIVIGKNNNNKIPNKVRKSSHETCTSPSFNKEEFYRSTRIVKCVSESNEIKSSISSKQKNKQLESKSPAINHINNFTESIELNEVIKHSSKDKFSEKNVTCKTSVPSTHIEVEQIPIRRKTIVIEKNNNCTALNEVKKSSHTTCTSPSINKEFNSSTRIVKCLSKSNEIKPPLSPKQKNNQLESKSPATNHVSNLTELNQQKDSIEYSKDKSPKESLTGKTSIPSINIEVEQGSIFRRSSARRVIMLPKSDDNKQEIKKRRHVQLITIQDHFSQPLPIFNGAKKTEIDVSKNSIHIEKVVESSSHFYVPQVKRRRTMNFGNADS